MSDFISGYEHDGFFDEVVDAQGVIRPHYLDLIERMSHLTGEDLVRLTSRLDESFVSQGITFTVYGDDQGTERTFPMDLLPRVIPVDEWRHVQAGLDQRMRTLNLFLDDLYVGGGQIVADKVIPRRLVESSDGYHRQAIGVPVPHAARCLVGGIDLIRDAEGTYRVLEDNVRNPSGVSYVVENRAAMTRLLPGLFEDGLVRPVDQYGRLLLQALQEVAPPRSGDSPCVVVLTPGVFNSAYFEHVFLATQMGVELVEGRDLVVDDHVVYVRTTAGLKRVDIIYRRIDDLFLDPVAFRADSTLGVPGLVNAARAGNVTIANAIGNGVADDKAVYAYVPDMVRYYLGEEPILDQVDTYLLWDPDHRAAVIDRLDEVVVKPVAEAGGYGLVIGPSASDEELAAAREAIEADPRNYIAQEVVDLSRHPCLLEGQPSARHIDLRPFVLSGSEVRVLPGGLTRVALRKGSLVVNSSQGGGSKDTWVLADPAEDTSTEDSAEPDLEPGGTT